MEINLLMPKKWFNGLPKAKNYVSKEDIIKGEKNYEKMKNLGYLQVGL